MRLILLLAAVLLAAACEGPGRPQAETAGAPVAAIEVPISEVQGSGPRSPLEGRSVTVEGIVVGEFGDGLGGVFIQSERDDGDPATAEGLFLTRATQAEPVLRSGDRVRATGVVAELGDGAQTLTALQAVSLEVTGQGSVAATVLNAAPALAEDWERYEGMLLTIGVPLTVTGNDGLSRFGELMTAFEGRLFAPTELAEPGPEATAIAADNARRLLRLDDGSLAPGAPDPWFLPEPWDHDRPVRTGSVVHGATGVLDQRFGSYRLQLTEPLAQVAQAPRPPAPSVPGDRRIAALNVLNLFNGDGDGGGFPTARGAATPADYMRQQAKLVATIQALDPDLVALAELENDGFGPESALAQFVAALNAAGPHDDWRFVDAGEGPGSNGIRVGIIHRATRFQTVGAPATFAAGPFERSSRAPLAQAFRAGSGPVFVVVANHFKSKGGCDGATGGNADSGDGQACHNATRVESARLLHDWLAGDPTGTRPLGTLILGDLNAHAQEDPLRLLYAEGWRDPFEMLAVERPHSYVWAGQSARLDHALVHGALADRLRGAAKWNSNSDEAERFSYRNDPGTTPWRASDHDPLLLGLDLAR
jgi:predicted extracellular nuclease